MQFISKADISITMYIWQLQPNRPKNIYINQQNTRAY